MYDDQELFARQAALDREIEDKIAAIIRRRRRLWAALGVLVAGLLGGALWLVYETLSTSPESDPRAHLAAARAFERGGDLGAAVAALKAALREDPENAEARWRLGQLYLALGDGNAAEKELGRARALGHQGLEVALALLRGKLLGRRYTEALVEAISIAPSTAQSLFLLGEANLGLGQIEKAEEAYREALERDPPHREAWLGLARAALARDALEAASDMLEGAREALGASVEPALLTGELRLREGRPAEARAAFEEALALDPEHPEGRLGVARALLAAGRPEAAVEHLQAVRRVVGKRPVIAYLEAIAAWLGGDLQAAATALRRALEEAPRHLDALFLLASIKHGEGDYSQAERLATRLLESDPEDRGARKLLASAYVELGTPQQAIDTLVGPEGEAIASDPETLALLARAYREVHDRERAAHYLEQAARFAPTQAEGSVATVTFLEAGGWQMRRCARLVNFCERCLYTRECR